MLKNRCTIRSNGCQSLGRSISIIFAILAHASITGPGRAAESPPLSQPQLSYKQELQRAIDRGVTWLERNQNSNGWWSSPDHPAVTALALMAYQGDPAGRFRSQDLKSTRKGYDFLLACVQPDGGIHRSNLVTYNTSLSLLALAAAKNPGYDPIMLRARKFLIGLQKDFGEKGKLDTPMDGGVGYGSKYEHSDMGNTLQALEALYHTKRLNQDKASLDSADLNWAAAIHFLQSCQNLPSHNTEPWASDDPDNKGGFIYYPGHSMAGTMTNSDSGRVALRSYGSISYGGLLSYIYADLKREDPRVQAVFDWLARNFTIEENPGLGPQGLYYYYHTMAKALTLYHADKFELADGRKIDWRKELSTKLLNLQQKDGSWENSNARWWEKDPALATSYAVLTLEIIYRGL